MTRKTGAYIVMVAGSILLIMNISEMDIGNIEKGPFLGSISNILLIAAMAVSIRNLNNKV